jgi:hypothetical protein
MDYKCLKNFESLAEFTEPEEICESNNATINSINWENENKFFMCQINSDFIDYNHI